MKRVKFLFSVVVFLILVSVSIAFAMSEVTGKVVGISDGDTITVLTPEKQQLKIRLAGVDTPESKQAFGMKAKQFTSDMVFGKQVRVIEHTKDRYGRTVAFVYAGNQFLNEELVKSGFAWVYNQYCNYDVCQAWQGFQESARSQKIGLWADQNPEAPWDFRKNKRAGQSETVSSDAVGGAFHGNSSSHVFHAPGCKHFNCKNCTVVFNSREEAIQAGYRPHKECTQ